ncbi:MAG: xanthine dehydrogenase family protein molybdopterin-binding subunit [Acidobacteriota bacterium]|nr:xanthine dehydrogenase family protein molybdopterin-binding subunit [Blastocatellia bacterium]MDW8411302.1 xanthine dehydrogenase family protein molybdopterin-binding subunit [Acidobacteriota bacterium]
MSVGTSVTRRDAQSKVTGQALYVDDYRLPNMWYGATVRSTVPHARIKNIHYSPNFDWSQVVICDYRDIPGRNLVALIYDDQPLLAESIVRHVGEPIVLVAAPSKELARKATRYVTIEYEELPAVLTIEESLARKQKLFGEDNIFKSYTITRGNVDEALASADIVVEGTYRVGHQEQLYIEPNGMIATVQADGTLLVQGSLQCPYYVHRALKELFELEDDKVVVIQNTTGGGFGGKEEFPSVVAGHAALLARKAGRPVKLVYDRSEDFIASTKRHPAIIRHRTGLTRDGRLIAAEIDLTFDGGAYCTLSPVVLSRGVIHALGPYNCPNVRISGRVVATNTPPNGAFRGFGVPQAAFAAEMQMERIAQVAGFSPVELRRKNMLREGDTTVTGQILNYSVGTAQVLDAAIEHSDYLNKLQIYRNQTGSKRRGIGLSLYYHGSGFTGSGEEKIKGRAAVEFDKEARIRILTGSTEIGQGTRTIFPQIVAEELGIDLAQIDFEESNTAKVPDSGPTVASRTCMVVGSVVQKAAAALKAELIRRIALSCSLPEEGVSYKRGIFYHQDQPLMTLTEAAARFCQHSPIRTEARYSSPPGIKWDDASYTGDAYPVYAYAADVVEVEVDMDTYEVKLISVLTVSDVGKAINPRLAEGQIEGGTVQALGYGLYEEVFWKDGHMLNTRLTNYIIPTALDIPDLETILIENPYPYGPFGAKGIGELPMDGGAPAAVAAIANATGAFITQLPATPERILEALCQSKHLSDSL